MKILDVIIPIYKPTIDSKKLIYRLLKQTISPGKIILINTEKAYWDLADMDAYIEEMRKAHTQTDIIVRHIKREEFDHGDTRNLGVSLTDAPYFVCMTDDAIPADRYLLENLYAGFVEEVGVVYARQIPKKGTDAIEYFTRNYNYGNTSYKKTEIDKAKYGIKLYFASNVCAMFDRKVFESLGGFPTGQILNEDMLYAAKLLKAGGAIYYAAEARVYHSHQYSGYAQLKRNFDIAVSQVDNPDIFKDLPAEGEGIRLVKQTAQFLLKKGRWYLLGRLLYISGCKYIGFRLGKCYRYLPRWAVRALSMHTTYWR